MSITLLYTFKGHDVEVPVYIEHEAPTAICPVCGSAVVDAALIQQHLDWHSERLGS